MTSTTAAKNRRRPPSDWWYSDSDVIAGAEKRTPQHSQDPFCLGFPFSHVVASQKFHRLSLIYLSDGIDQYQQEDHAEEAQALHYTAPRYVEAYRQPASQHLGQYQVHQLIEQYPQQNRARHMVMPYRCIKFPTDDFRYVAFFHAQNVVETEFASPAFEQKAVDIEQEDQQRISRRSAVHVQI